MTIITLVFPYVCPSYSWHFEHYVEADKHIITKLLLLLVDPSL